MYVIRSALRASTGRAPARLIRGRRYPSIPRTRSLHTTRPLALASAPPPGPDSTPVGEDGADKADREKAAIEEHQADAEAANEDPDLLAQKVQRSRETTRRYLAAQRRQQRGRKAQGLPPVNIPDWFLKRRVLRREDVPAELQHHITPKALSVSITHGEAGESATCSIPASKDLDAVKVLARLVRGLWGRRLDDQEKRKIEQYLDERVLVDTESSAERELGPIGNKAHSMGAEELLNELNSKTQRYMLKREHAKSRSSRGSKCLSPVVLAEVRANIAASLSTLRPSIGNTFPATKTNLVLHSPVPDHELLIGGAIEAIALELDSDLIVLRANDLAQLAGDYLGEGAEPSPRSIRSLGYETYRLSSELANAFEDMEKDDGAEDDLESAQPSSMDSSEKPKMGAFPLILPLSALASIKELSNKFRTGQLTSANPFEPSTNALGDEPSRVQSQSEIQLEDLKLATLLEALIDASELKQSRSIVGHEGYELRLATEGGLKKRTGGDPNFFDYSVRSEGMPLELNSALPAAARPGISLSLDIGSVPAATPIPKKSKIIYVRDFKELNATHYGGRIIQKLEELVRKRRSAGESIMIVGSTCSLELTPDLSASGVHGLQSEGESSFFRTIVVAADSDKTSLLDESNAMSKGEIGSAILSPKERGKFCGINMLHTQDMLRSLDPVASARISDMELTIQHHRNFAAIIPEAFLNRVLTYDEVHRIALTALGLHVTTPTGMTQQDIEHGQVNWAHVALAMGLLKTSDTVKYLSFDKTLQKQQPRHDLGPEAEAHIKAKKRHSEVELQRQRDLARITATATKHEKRLISGIANPDQIKTTFDQVHVPKETVDSIRTITSLSLLRPDAFNYGILATEKISGALLYGPPGTGKTLLAKAVAKESGSTVLEVSGSQIMDKYVGEGEKNVAAIFSLARKLSPCIVFLDEADAVFASRDAMRERTSHRDILNQFLKEWDGLNDLSVFVMVATNRPFDLDDAVIRRLPRRLLVDLPTQADRKEILRIHLKGEQLDPSVDLEDLAKRTPFYSGSDLKNVAVSAALACVKEENEVAAKAAAEATLETPPPEESSTAESKDKDDAATPAFLHHTDAPPPPPPPPSFPTPPPPESIPSPSAPPTPAHLVRGINYNFPAIRILLPRHFDAALQEISASISEDMSSLGAIKKFDEQFGDKKGKKGKKGFGFGENMAKRDENAARVRG
ncbi:ATPase family AAA domain-containing protein 1-A [Lizonia empirigonia]|nr:ATPase family AAA domain-containing protein 1-A [Lizonia empirigonia]